MPFTAEQFFQVFEKYNQNIFPMQIILVAAAALMTLSAIRRKSFSDEIISGVLALLWLWAGVVYHLSFFVKINPAAYLFGAMFILQGLFFFWQGIIKKRLTFRFEPDVDGVLGLILVGYALVLYPLIGSALGHSFPASPTFGTPCPTTIFTFGLLMWTDKKFALFLLTIPLLWSLIGTLAAINFGVKEDFGLLTAAVIGTVFIIRRRFTLKKEVFL